VIRFNMNNKERLFEMMNKLDPKFKNRVNENTIQNPPTILYHGSNQMIDLNSLKIDRTGLNLQNKSTGSANADCYGFYVTPNIWDVGINRRNIVQPLYNIGTTGNDSAEKYANWGFGKSKKAYIFEIQLSNDIKLQQGSNACINNNDFLAYLKDGIDGIFSVSEGVLFNKEKITAIKPIYYADKYMYQIIEDVRGKLDHSNSVIVPYNSIDAVLKKNLGAIYHLQRVENGIWIYWDGEKGGNNSTREFQVSENFVLDWQNV